MTSLTASRTFDTFLSTMSAVSTKSRLKDASRSTGFTKSTGSMSGRQILSPNPVDLNFDAVTVHSRSATPKTKSANENVSAHSANSKKTVNSGKRQGHSTVAGIEPSNGITLVGYKMKGDASDSSKPTEGSAKPTKWTPLGSALPPCRVCGDEASGLHYGVNTCEACKAFFRRTLKRQNVDFQCTCSPEERALGTDKPRKTTCPKCRYERCTKLGMSKDAIKIGRYTIGRKRQNDREVRKLKEDVSKSNSPHSPGMFVSSPEEVTQDLEKILDLGGSSKKKQTAAADDAKKMRRATSNDPDSGLLVQSLTNSILQILQENQSRNESALFTPPTLQQKQPDTEYSPMEQLLMKPFDPTLGNMTIGTANATDGSHSQFQFALQQQQQQQEQQQQQQHQQTNKSQQNRTIINVTGQHQSIHSPNAAEGLVHSDPQVAKTNPVASQNRRNIPAPLIQVNGVTTITVLTPPKSDPALRQTNYSTIPPGFSPNQSPKDPFPDSPSGSTGSNNGQSPGFIASPHGSTYSELTNESSPLSQTAMQPSPIESLLMSPPSVALSEQSSFQDRDPVLSAKFLAYAEHQVPGAESLLPEEMENYMHFERTDLKTVPTNNDIAGFELYEPDLLKLEDVKGPIVTAEHFGTEQYNEHINFVSQDNLEAAGDLENFVEDPFDPTCEFFDPANENLDAGEEISMAELNLQHHAFDRFQCPFVRAGYNMSQEEINSMTTALTNLAVSLQTKTEIMTCQEIKQRHKAYLEQYEAKQKMFGKTTISHAEYLAFYQETGIDIDNRQEMIIEMLKYIEDSITKLVNFAKGIPGFCDFHIDDQILLMKASRFEHDMIKLGGQKCTYSNNIVTMPWNKEYHIEELQKLMPTAFCANKGRVKTKIVMMNFSLQEQVLLRAMVITCPDHVNLREPVKVEAVHKKIIVCLLAQLEKRTPESMITIEEILNLIFELRDLSRMENKMMAEVFEIWPLSQNHQLVKEFVSDVSICD